MSNGGTGSTNTVTQSQQIPQFEQDASQANQQLAQSIGAQPYPVYQGALIQGMTPLQQQGETEAVNAAGAAQPYINAAGASVGSAMTNTAANPNTIASYMSPYVQQSLIPQLTQAETQLGQEQQGINTTATQANAFGDARQGAAQALQNYYGNLDLSGIESTGLNTAYNNAVSATQAQQGTDLNAASALGSLGTTAQNTQLAGAGATYTAGQQQQTQGQTELNAAYQQYLNQINWPIQMLNVQESALSNSPYDIATAVTLPQSNATAQGFGALAGLSGLLGSASSGASGGAGNIFGGA